MNICIQTKIVVSKRNKIIQGVMRNRIIKTVSEAEVINEAHKIALPIKPSAFKDFWIGIQHMFY